MYVWFDILKLGKCGVFVGKIIFRIDLDYVKKNVERDIKKNYCN